MHSNKLSFCIQLSIADFYFAGLHDIQVGRCQGHKGTFQLLPSLPWGFLSPPPHGSVTSISVQP